MCFTPIKIKVHENYKKYRSTLVHAYNDFQVMPCGKCYQCRELKIEEWQIRWHEQLKTSIPQSSYLLTLTYSDKYLPHTITPDGEIKSTLDYTHVQKFLKRLRKRQDKLTTQNNIDKVKITYQGCGEYGKKFTKRPHYHLLITNLIVPPDELETIWKYGKIHIGDNVNQNTVKYVLKYTLKNALENRKKTKVYNYEKVTVNGSAYPDQKKIHSILDKLKIPYHNPQIKETIIEKNKIKLSEIYQKNDPDEYRITEKTFCSKGIGKSFITDEIIYTYQSKPSLNYVWHNLQENTLKEKPLPRYYKELIFNPKLRDQNGKLQKDQNGKYIQKYDPKNHNYEETPRYKKQFVSYYISQKKARETMQIISQIGLSQYITNQLINKQLNKNIWEKQYRQRENLQNDKNHKQGLAQLI